MKILRDSCSELNCKSVVASYVSDMSDIRLIQRDHIDVRGPPPYELKVSQYSERWIISKTGAMNYLIVIRLYLESLPNP